MSLELLAVTHVNVNCSDLERSMRFYRDLVGLEPQSHTRPQPQEGAGFGLPGQVVWDAYLLHDDRAQGGPAIDLLEWQTPSPVGKPPPEANHLGFMRVCLAAENLDALHARLEAAGVRTRSEPVEVPVLAGQTVRPGDVVTIVSNPLMDGSPGGNLVALTLPDGTTLSAQPGIAPNEVEELSGADQ